MRCGPTARSGARQPSPSADTTTRGHRRPHRAAFEPRGRRACPARSRAGAGRAAAERCRWRLPSAAPRSRTSGAGCTSCSELQHAGIRPRLTPPRHLKALVKRRIDVSARRARTDRRQQAPDRPRSPVRLEHRSQRRFSETKSNLDRSFHSTVRLRGWPRPALTTEVRWCPTAHAAAPAHGVTCPRALVPGTHTRQRRSGRGHGRGAALGRLARAATPRPSRRSAPAHRGTGGLFLSHRR